ncbi:GATA type zinc finger [Ceratobasidium sp. AG-Ba]|nr:GATA type zinc finger [Ceratobasidium sp. AG-Ba]
MAAASDHELDDEMRDHIGDRLPSRGYDDSQRPRAHSVLPPPPSSSSRRQSYDTRPDPRDLPPPRRQSMSAAGMPGQGWHSPPPPAGPGPYYNQQDAFGATAYMEPRAQMPPPPPPPGHWGYQLPPPQSYQPRPSRSPGPYDPRTPYRPGQPPYGYPAGYGPPGPPYPGPSGATVDPNIFKSDPYGRHPGMPASPGPDPSRPDVQITYTDDSATKLTQYLRRRCFNCRVTEPPGWRKSTLNPGKIVCNKCGLYERSHARPRPLHMDNPKGPAQ